MIEQKEYLISITKKLQKKKMKQLNCWEVKKKKEKGGEQWTVNSKQ